MWPSKVLLRAVAPRGALILSFHRISPQDFCAWLEPLMRAFSLISIDELVARREHGLPLKGLLAITFDDGWRDTCEPIAELCEANGWPITIYLMSSLLAGGRRFWFAELPGLLGAAAGRRFIVDDDVIDLRRDAASATEARLIRRLRLLPRADAIAVVDRISAASGANWQPVEPGFVDTNFVNAYRASACVAFGSHSIDHQALCAQSEAQIEHQLSESRAALETRVGRPIRHFCYPYGSCESIGAIAPRLVKRHYASAVTMIRGVCTGTCDLSYLRRIDFYPTDNEARVVAKVVMANVGAA